MRKNKIMLLAALVASPFAMANDYGYGGYDDFDDVTIEGSFNETLTLNADATIEKTYTEDYVGNEDNDKLIMKNVGNSYYADLEDNSKNDWSVIENGHHEWEELMAESMIDGAVMGNTVAYGGACCQGKGTDVIVDHSNTMYNGYTAASGINIAGQNVGNNSMVQQTTSTNAALVGSGGASLPGGGGSY
ncbi:hypothetical protein [Photobacterium lutimaris]|uniref:Uncharacterized protein n=1 Tax=Photobacterium lutimaris TaxID=388278 RepID=A0A2T3IZC3_9GAMM|nr:hypothetical protein [Photobacterium lutimaris]PSU33994.1 hypothetical protein C9I99_11565 [Photobacterium lutimaris]TDR76331.1 hypothetical protein DFP78_103327 [Photobacterium lutimaris]